MQKISQGMTVQEAASFLKVNTSGVYTALRGKYPLLESVSKFPIMLSVESVKGYDKYRRMTQNEQREYRARRQNG